MCDVMNPDDVPVPVVNQILSAIIDGLRADRPNDIRLAAIEALCNSLDFTHANFDIDGERDAIVRTVCDATQCPEIKVRENSFECLAKIADLYYEKLNHYVDTIFQLTTTAIRTDEEKVALQAIEVWSTVGDRELSLLEDIAEGDRPAFFNIIAQATPALVPILLEVLSKQEEDLDSDDTWNVAMAGASCIEVIAKIAKDGVVDVVLPFVTSNFLNTDWRLKDAAIIAFGKILEGPSPEKLLPILVQAIPVLIGHMQDPCALVRDSAAWTVARICDLHKAAISAEVLPVLVNALAATLEDSHPKVAAQACFAVHNLAVACGDENEAPSNILSHFMPMMLQKLFILSNRSDWDVENLRISAYEAVNEMVNNSALDMRPVVIQVLNEALNRLEVTFASPANQERVDLQSMLCALIGVCTQRLSESEFTPFADRSMQLLLQVISGRGTVAHEDGFMTISYIADKVGKDFTRYMQFLQAPLISGLKNVEEYQVCTCAVGVVGDICRNIGVGVVPFCDEIMRCLIELLQSATLNKIVKPHVISSFADIAMAIEGEFDRYTPIILVMLKQAGEIRAENTEDEEFVEYINSLHVAILDAYSGILQVSIVVYFLCA